MDPGVCLVHPSKRQPVGVCPRPALSLGRFFQHAPPEFLLLQELLRFLLVLQDRSIVSSQVQISLAVAAAAPAAAELQHQGSSVRAIRRSRFGDGFSSARNCQANAAGSYQSPLVSASATPVAHHVDRDHRGARNPHHHSGGGGKLSWISSLFGLRKRKKKSSHNGAVETNFFPPEAWNDDFHHRGAHADRDRLWRSRSVSSGRVIKKSFTPLGDPPLDHPGAPTGIDPATSSLEPPRASAQGIEPRVASLIALDMTKVITNAAYDVEDSGDGGAAYVAGPRSSVASLMDIDRKCAAATCASPTVLQRSRSTGGWRRMIRSESPSSVLANPTAHGSGNGNSDWGFYLTPLRTFNKSRGGSKQGR